jgi:hypothetical protein
MRFPVVWNSTAEQELARVWLNAPDRRTVSLAAGKIDQLLQSNAHVGESRTGSLRILHEPPLGVLFEASLQDAIVRVVQVWRFETHGR